MTPWYYTSDEIDLSQRDVEALNQLFQIEAESIGSSNWDQVTDSEFAEALRPLAELGSSAYQKVFGAYARLGVIKTSWTGSRSIRKFISSLPRRGFFLPWEMTYTGNLREGISLSSFWGMRYNPSRRIAFRPSQAAFVSNCILTMAARAGTADGSEVCRKVDCMIPYFEVCRDLVR